MRVSLPEGSASRSSAVQARRGRLSDRPAEAQAREAVHLAGAKGVMIESKGNAHNNSYVMSFGTSQLTRTLFRPFLARFSRFPHLFAVPSVLPKIQETGTTTPKNGP